MRIKNIYKMQGIPYKKVVELLMYAMVATKANVAFVVSVVSQFMEKPNPMH